MNTNEQKDTTGSLSRDKIANALGNLYLQVLILSDENERLKKLTKIEDDESKL